MAITAILSGLQAGKLVIRNAPESVKRKLDTLIDALEDLKKEGTWEDEGIEFMCTILRGQFDIEDYPDDVDNAEDKT